MIKRILSAALFIVTVAFSLSALASVTIASPPPAAPPTNDNFSAAQVITGCNGTVAGSNVGATKETGEPNHSPDNMAGSRSVWYRWQAPSTGTATIATAGSNFDTVLAVYTGNSVNLLTVIAKNDDIAGDDTTSGVTFSATAGTVYMIAVDGFDSGDGGATGSITLNWSLATCSPTPPQIILEESGPIPTQAAALDGMLFVRDPFLVINSSNLLIPPADPNTRVLLFVTGGQLAQGEPPSAMVVNLVDSSDQTHNIPALDIRAVPDQTFNQVTFRLPDGLPLGTCQIKVLIHGQVSNTAKLRISG